MLSISERLNLATIPPSVEKQVVIGLRHARHSVRCMLQRDGLFSAAIFYKGLIEESWSQKSGQQARLPKRFTSAITDVLILGCIELQGESVEALCRRALARAG